MIVAYQFKTGEVMVKGHGGAREGAGRHSKYGEPMPRFTLRLSQEHQDFIGNGGSGRLRALLAWGVENQESLIDDPGYNTETRTMVTLPPHVADQAMRLGQKAGKGAFISGVRRVIATVIALGLDPDELVMKYGDGD